MSSPTEQPAGIYAGEPVLSEPETYTNRTMLILSLALLALLVPVHKFWTAQFILILLLFTVPGIILLRALRVPGIAITSFPLYVPCASLAVLLGSGLATNFIGPAVGITAPLRPWPMLVGLEMACGIMLAVPVKTPASVAIPWHYLPRPRPTALLLLIPLLAAAGATRLNANHGNAVALIALSACIVVTIAVVFYAAELDVSLVAVAIYAVSLAILWSFSLRGNSVYGFDISDEYYILQHTVSAGVWHPPSPANPANAYIAMLSTTVLPAELHAVSGASNLIIFKAVYPAVSALFPVAVFFLGRRILSTRWAFAASALIITQSGFGQELPGIARQEIALVLFAALVAAILEANLPRRAQWPLVILFALAMVVSHYTTTYVTVTLLGMTLFFQLVTSWFRPIPHVSGGVVAAFAAAVVGSLIWYVPVTHSSSNIAYLAKATRAQGLDLLPNRSQAGSVIAAYLDGNTITPLPAEKYDRLIQIEYAENKPFVHPLPAANNRMYQLHDFGTPTPPVRWPAIYKALSVASVIAQQLVYLLGAIGALILVFRRRLPATARQVGLLSIATLMFLLAIRFSGTLATFYNAERALLQSMVFFDISLFWCMPAWVGKPGRSWRQVCAVYSSVALIAIIFLTNSGFAGAVFGGGTETNLANSGNDYRQFYVTKPELASANWLGGQIRQGQLVYADQYGQLPLVSMTGINTGLLLDLAPQSLDRQAWVYASQTNVVDGQARASFQGHSISYIFPSEFLDANYNLVYTNGSSKVYHR